MNDVTTAPQHNNPFQRALATSNASANVGAIAVEQERAIAEAQGKLVLAKRFPRDLNAAHAELMIACKSPAFAAVAFYAKPQGGSTVTGPSIRMAEQIAQVVGNFEYGHRELSRDNRKSEVEVFAWDMEKNSYAKRQKTVLHVRDTRDGPKPLRDQTDVDQKINNVASKEMRGLILALMPKWLVEDAIQECRKTIAGNNDEPLDVRVRRMTQAFAKYGVKPEHLEKHLGHSLDKILLDELVDLQGIFNSLRDGTPASEIFGDQDEEQAPAATTPAAAQAIAAASQKPQASAATSKARGNSKATQTQSKPVEDAAPAAEQNDTKADPAEENDSGQLAAANAAAQEAAAAGAAAGGEEDPLF